MTKKYKKIFSLSLQPGYRNYTVRDLSEISSRIINNVKEVNRVLYDFTSKPPGTIEWK